MFHFHITILCIALSVHNAVRTVLHLCNRIWCCFARWRNQIVTWMQLHLNDRDFIIRNIYKDLYWCSYKHWNYLFQFSFVNLFTVRPILIYLYLMFIAAVMGCVWQLVIKENDDDDDDDDDLWRLSAFRIFLTLPVLSLGWNAEPGHTTVIGIWSKRNKRIDWLIDYLQNRYSAAPYPELSHICLLSTQSQKQRHRCSTL